MMKYVVMLVVCIIVGVTLSVIMYFFFRALNRIEIARWGDKAKMAGQESLKSELLRRFRKKPKK